MDQNEQKKCKERVERMQKNEQDDRSRDWAAGFHPPQNDVPPIQCILGKRKN